MVPNTKYTFLSLITGKPRYSKSKQTLGFERELVNKKFQVYYTVMFFDILLIDSVYVMYV